MPRLVTKLLPAVGDESVRNAYTRREWLGVAPAAIGAIAALATTEGRAEAVERAGGEPFGYCLNTSTIRGQNLSLEREAELAAAAGFQALEPWIGELETHAQSGGSLEALGRTLRDLGLSVESAIGFFDWVVDDPERRRKAFDDAKRNMELVQRVGGKRLAAPPAGTTDRDNIDPKRIAERYRALLETGDAMGVVPQVEFWGVNKTIGRLDQAAQVAIAADHPRACILPDVYHMYKGGSGFRGVRLLAKDAIHVIHLNDYPASPPRDKINDSDRVYPGDGIAPLGLLFRDLDAIGFRGMLSVELFNRTYYAQDAATVLKTAISKLKSVVKQGLSAGKPADAG